MEFKQVKLGELSIDGKGSYGIAASAVDFNEELPTYLRITDISEDGNLLINSLKSVDEPNAKNYSLKPNDIVFARTGNSTGKSYFYDGSDGELIYAGFLIKFSLDESKVNPKFIRYYTLSEEYKGWVKGFSTGSTRGNINAKSYANMQIDLPPRKYQNFVVDILSSLENKIKLNNSIILNLEQLSQTLFKHWFIDFEFPNEQGQPYKSSGGEMVESELGEIPKLWKTGIIDEIGTVVGGGTPSKKYEEYYTTNGISWITPKDLSNNKSLYIYKGAIDITELGLRKGSARLLPEKTVLFSSRAPIGYIAIAGKEVTTNQGFKSIVPNKGFNPYFIYHLLYQKLPIIEAAAGGSTFKEISGKGLKEVPIVIPSKNITELYKDLVEPLFLQIQSLERENHKLEQLRDTLLPKLLSGEIEIPDELEVK